MNRCSGATSENRMFVGTCTSIADPCSRQVYKTEELQMIADLCIKHDVLCISDEVYEWLTYDGAKHVKIGEMQPELI